MKTYVQAVTTPRTKRGAKTYVPAGSVQAIPAATNAFALPTQGTTTPAPGFRASLASLPFMPTTSLSLLDYPYHPHNERYCGFVGPTSISVDYSYRPDTGVFGAIAVFIGDDIAGQVRVDELWGYTQPLPPNQPVPHVQILTGQRTIKIAEHGSGDWRDVVVPLGSDVWGMTGGNPAGVDTERFDRIVLFPVKDPFRVTNLRLELNGIELVNRSFPGGVELSYENPLHLDWMIWEGRLEKIGYSTLNTLYFKNIDRDEHQSKVSRDCVLWGAMDYAQAWNPRYGEWDFSSDDYTRSYVDQPKEWCSEWANWTIARATRGAAVPEPIGTDMSSADLRSYFRDHGAWIAPEEGFPFEALGDRIRPGYYVRVKGGTHSTFFLRWDNRHMPNRSDFDPDGTNHFLGLGGNQGNVVSVNKYRLRKHKVGDYIWPIDDGINWYIKREHGAPQYVHDGFGDTSKLPRWGD